MELEAMSNALQSPGLVEPLPVEQRLDEELARRLNELNAPQRAHDDCAASARPIVVEALCWIALGAVLWLSVLMLAS
jgi:hypothetical protein